MENNKEVLEFLNKTKDNSRHSIRIAYNNYITTGTLENPKEIKFDDFANIWMRWHSKLPSKLNDKIKENKDKIKRQKNLIGKYIHLGEDEEGTLIKEINYNSDYKDEGYGYYVINGKRSGEGYELTLEELNELILNKKSGEFYITDKKLKNKPNIYAICTKSVGRTNEKKYRKCKEDVQKNIGNPVTENQVREVVKDLNNGEKSKYIFDKYEDEIPSRFIGGIMELNSKELTPHEIWEEIELDEAIKKFPGRKLSSRDLGTVTIKSISEIVKIKPSYRVFFTDSKSELPISKNGLINLWTTGNFIDVKLLPETTTSEKAKKVLDKVGEELGIGLVNIKVQDNEFSRLFKKISDHFKAGKKETVADYNKWKTEYEKISPIESNESAIWMERDLQGLIKIARKLNNKK